MLRKLYSMTGTCISPESEFLPIKLVLYKQQDLYYELPKVYRQKSSRSSVRAKRKCTIFGHFRRLAAKMAIFELSWISNKTKALLDF